ncbi:MAG: carbohydrate kinase family protein, partial [Verrucomicrobiota bacterium]
GSTLVSFQTGAGVAAGLAILAAVAAARLGSRVAMVDRLGTDMAADRIREDFENHGVEQHLLTTETEGTSSTANILVHGTTADRAIIFHPGSASLIEPPPVPESEIAASRILHLNGRHWATAFQAARQCRAHGTLVSFDGGSNRPRSKMKELLPYVDIAIVTDEFASHFAGPENEPASTFFSFGLQVLVITRGAAGSDVFLPPGDSPHHQPAYPASPLIDTTGCGDAYHGAFLSGIAAGKTVQQSAVAASACAALNATGLGGRANLPDRPVFERFLREMKKN